MVFQPPDLFQVFLKNISCTIAAAGCYYSPLLHVGTFLPFDFSRHGLQDICGNRKETQCDFIDGAAMTFKFPKFPTHDGQSVTSVFFVAHFVFLTSSQDMIAHVLHVLGSLHVDATYIQHW